ncbi:3-keto-disaccharide hydrolase [Dyadobacter frigoris]|uniref:DUF1080 domain-containing protein n=1 Tax=Dyadobacter frigoris TaxID=2576211 RepID=A0A4U6CVZ3_9BACT|nr:DUF1080 domain-containing protein [Dyadobacter frigoris]TKT88959.1 DUF1080 domain-containing protein [Dyadobacter frigoris]
MKTINFLTLAFLISLFLPQTSCMAQSSDKTVRLFNGKNLKGWYSFIENRGRNHDVKKVFTVEKGLIHISGEEYGSIMTNKEYENYRLKVEFKWGDKTYKPRADNARDNGILVHSTGPDGGFRGIWMYSIECQIIEGGTGDFLVVGDGTDNYSLTASVAPKKEGGGKVFQPAGEPLTIHSGRIDWFGRDPQWKDIKGFVGASDIEKPAGEWNTMECVAEGDRISIYVNGILVNQASRVEPSKGRIQIQSEGAEMYVRKVELTHLQVK